MPFAQKRSRLLLTYQLLMSSTNSCERSCSLRDAVIAKIVIHCFYHGVHFGQQPLVHNRKLIVIQTVYLVAIKIVNVRVQHEECVGIPQGAHELTLSLHALPFRGNGSAATVRC